MLNTKIFKNFDGNIMRQTNFTILFWVQEKVFHISYLYHTCIWCLKKSFLIGPMPIDHLA